MAEVAIIGAGMAGLACARVLADAGVTVRVFEKSRGAGGRLATRRSDDLRFDHGAAYVDARGAAFRSFLEAAVRAGHAAPFATVEGPVFVGVPGNNALVKAMADGVDVVPQTEITALSRSAQGWHLATKTGDAFGPFASVVAAVPARQAHALLQAHDPAFEVAGAIEMQPQITAMVSFAAPAPDIAEGTHHVSLNGETAELTFQNETAKPGRSKSASAWVVRADRQWSAANLDMHKDEIAALFAKALADAATGTPPLEPTLKMGHRWAFSTTPEPLGRAVIQSADGTLIAAGDWCLGPRAEDAFLSGQAAARAAHTHLAST